MNVNMNHCEDQEDEVLHSKITLSGEHETQIKAQRTKLQRREPDESEPGSESEPSCVSLQSRDPPIAFKAPPSETNVCSCGRNQNSSDPSCASKETPIAFASHNFCETDSDQQSSDVLSSWSAARHQTELDCIFM
ncbi:hypothetical protein GOODEAATRI_029808, partial [Goodea atripinnis]